MKKEERHQIKRDDLAAVLGSASDYLELHLRTTIAIGALVLVAAGGVLGGWTWWRHREARSSSLLGDLIQTYNAPVTSTNDDQQQARPGALTFTSSEERDRKVLEIADGILKGGASGAATAGALLYRGMALADLNRPDEAAGAFEQVVRDHAGGIFGPVARLRLARLKEARGQPADALTLYQAIADDAAALLPREEGLFGMARCQEALGKKDEAIRIYQRIVTEFPKSEYASEAKARVAELS